MEKKQSNFPLAVARRYGLDELSLMRGQKDEKPLLGIISMTQGKNEGQYSKWQAVRLFEFTQTNPMQYKAKLVLKAAVAHVT